jgi:hypothetical protein
MNLSLSSLQLASKGRRNGFFECRIESYRKANVKLVISQIRIVT